VKTDKKETLHLTDLANYLKRSKYSPKTVTKTVFYISTVTCSGASKLGYSVILIPQQAAFTVRLAFVSLLNISLALCVMKNHKRFSHMCYSVI